MSLVDLEVNLTYQERAVRDTAHTFAEEVMRPAGIQLDRLSGPTEVIAPQSVLWEVFKAYRELGLHDLDRLDATLTPVERVRLRFLICEELGWGDVGLAASLGVGDFHRGFASRSGNDTLIERFCGPDNHDIGCWAITEPDHGSDTLMVTEPHFDDPERQPNCIAQRDGDDYVIRGQKSSWVSNGSIATVATLFCAVASSNGLDGGGVCLVPLDIPGVTRGKPLDKLGQRSLNQGEIFFDDVRIPADYMVVGPDAYTRVVEQVLIRTNAWMGMTFVGLARAALEFALTYAKQRLQGGVPIFAHQNVKGRLFTIFSQVEAARSLARRVMLYNTATNPPLLQYSIASKVFCTSTAFEVASQALQIFSGYGLSREFPIEKLFRDARASMIQDGCNDVLSLVGAAKL
jgi:alkylation response protein AidB-like acyl-CoA dehydrogenase